MTRRDWSGLGCVNERVGHVPIRSFSNVVKLGTQLAKYRSLIPSLALLIHLAEEGIGQVSDCAVERAIGWGQYLESHARRVYAMVASVGLTAAHKLAEKIRSKALKDGFGLRDIYRSGWAGLNTREEAQTAARVLIDHDWLAVTKEFTEGAPRTRYWVNPKIWQP